MNKRLQYKLFLDLVMCVIFLLVMVVNAVIGTDIHELLGVLFFILLITHNLLNLRWYKCITKGKYNLIRLLHTITNLLLFGLIFINLLTALGISIWIFTFLPIDWGLTGLELHILSAYWGMILLAIHIGFHWDMLMAIMKKMVGICHESALRTIILRVIIFVIIIYGFYAAVKLDISARLTAYSAFFFFNESKLMIIIDHLTFFCSCIILTHYSLKILRMSAKLNKSR